MGLPLILLLFICIAQKTLWAQHSIEDVESKASAIVQQAKSQMLILANQLITNVSLVTRSAEGNASLLLANLYNDINKGIAEAQEKANKIGNSLQGNFSKWSEEVKFNATTIYTLVETELQNFTSRMAEAMGFMISSTEDEIMKALNKTKSRSSSNPSI